MMDEPSPLKGNCTVLDLLCSLSKGILSESIPLVCLCTVRTVLVCTTVDLARSIHSTLVDHVVDSRCTIDTIHHAIHTCSVVDLL